MSKYQCNVNNFSIEKDERFFAYINITGANRIVKLLNEQEERIKELEREKESWKSSACHDMNLKSMLSFEIGKLSETKDIDAFLDFYYKYFCKIDGDDVDD